MGDLEPCPFCGGEAEFSVGKTGDDKDWHYIECGECEAMGPRVEYADHNIAIKDALAEAWNRRAIPAADARAEALKEALQALRGAGSFGRTAAEKHAALEQYCLCRDAILALIPEKQP